MGSFPGSSEIVEAEDEPSSSRHGKGIYQQNSVIEDDINKLFETISIRTTKGLGPSQQSSPLNKYASKRPITMGTPRSPGLGNSEPATLKQALRELSLTKASEMAALRRLSKMTGSTGPSEAGRIKTLYNTVVLESGKSSLSLDERKGNMVEISLTPVENASAKVSRLKSPNQSVDSSPRFAARAGTRPAKSKKLASEPSPSCSDHCSEISEAVKVPSPSASDHRSEISEVVKVPSTSGKVGIPTIKSVLQEKEKHKSEVIEKVLQPTKPRNKPPSSSKGGQKSRLHSSSTSGGSGGNRVSKLSRTSPRLMKSISRNRSLAKKKIKPDITIALNEDPSKGQLVCERCHCTMSKKPAQASLPAEAKAKKNTKASKDKGEFFSQSSQGEYSSSTTMSEESNLSGSSCGSRPHMSKDVRWEAIRQALLQQEDGGMSLDHFNLLKKLGCGDIGTVYLAELIATNCLFAIKVMDNEFLARRKKMPRAQTEREILRMLDHPFLPTLYSQFTSDNLSCLVMEYCPGGDLHVLRQKQPGRNYPEPAARFYVAEVLLALEYLHMLGVVYRDLKPENVLVREDGHIMLTDFDLSLRCSVNPTLLQSVPLEAEPTRRRSSGPCTESSCAEPFCIQPSCQVPCFTPRLLPSSAKATKTAKTTKAELAEAARLRSLPQLVAEPTEARSNSFVGTHEYLAPEIIKGEGHGAAVDWWTFGVFLYELLYGRTPFKGANNEETLANVVMQTLKFPDSPIVSFQARDLIRDLLVKEPEYRFGMEKGAAEIKQHPFFEGLNWALIRCAAPPEVPEFCEFEVPNTVLSQGGPTEYLECKATGEVLEFELF